MHFLYEISQIITRTQKHCQDQESLPPERKVKIEQLISSLQSAQASFSNNQCPISFEVHAPESSRNKLPKWPAWKFFKEQVAIITSTLTFKGVPLLFPGEQGRRTRSVSQEVTASTNFISDLYLSFSKFLTDYINQLEGYFFPWPTWLSLSENLFLFDNDLNHSTQTRLDFRLSQLDCLFDQLFRQEPMTNDEKFVLKRQYENLTMAAFNIYNECSLENQKHLNSKVWYKICTTPVIFQTNKEMIHMALCFLVRDQNECAVESLIGEITTVDSSSRPRILHETVTKQAFVHRNGPHPLLSEEVRKAALDKLFPKSLFPNGWHFLSAERIGKFHSTTVSRHENEAKNTNNFCF